MADERSSLGGKYPRPGIMPDDPRLIFCRQEGGTLVDVKADEPLTIPHEWSWGAPGVADHFDQHVREQLPWYDWATTGLVEIVRNYLPPHGTVYDIGAATGNVELACRKILDERQANFYAVEPSPQLRSIYRGESTPIAQTAQSLDPQEFDVAVFMLTLCFVPVADRVEVVAKFMKAVRPGGCLIFVEKMWPVLGYPATVLQRVSWAMKLEAGNNPGDVLQKDMSLAGVQRPVRQGELPHHAVEWFRCGDFAGWLIEAPR